MSNSIDEIIANKIYSMINYLLALIIKPDITLGTVRELTENEIDDLITLGIKGIILDVDDTLRDGMKKIPMCNSEWLEMAKKRLKVIALSNGSDNDVENFFKLKGINYIGFANKPLKKSFNKACELMDLKPDEVLVIGDSIFSDIYGGKRNNMATARVQYVEKEDEYQI